MLDIVPMRETGTYDDDEKSKNGEVPLNACAVAAKAARAAYSNLIVACG